MIFLYNKNTNEVKMFSENEITFSNVNFEVITIAITEAEKEKLNGGYRIFIKNNKLIFTKL